MNLLQDGEHPFTENILHVLFGSPVASYDHFRHSEVHGPDLFISSGRHGRKILFVGGFLLNTGGIAPKNEELV